MGFGAFVLFWVRNPLAPYSGHNLQNREKRVSESKARIYCHPRTGSSDSKNPHLYTGHDRENKDFFYLERPFSGVA